MNNFNSQKAEVKRLHKKYSAYLSAEFGERDYFCYLSNPDNFIDGVFYHQANSLEEKNGILKNGFDPTKVRISNCGMGRGLYLGRDKNALINFYANDVNNPQDFTIRILGSFNFLDLIKNQEFLQINKKGLEEKVLNLGYDGVRYYDPDATGEEFVLFNHSKILMGK